MSRRAAGSSLAPHSEQNDWAVVETKGIEPTSGVYKQKKRFMKVKVGNKILHIPRNMLGGELKRYVNSAHWDQETLDAPSGTASVKGTFAYITQGTNAEQRIGDVIRVTKVVFRIYLQQSVSQTFCTASLAAVLDKEPAVENALSAVPAWTEMFQGIGASSAEAYNVAVANFDKRFRFDYLKRVTLGLGWTAAYWNGSSAVVSIKPEVLTMELNVNRNVRYDSTSATPYLGTELLLVGWSDVTSNTPKANASVEVFFTDV